MSWINDLIRGTAKVSNEEMVEAGACPNCWGEQAFDGKFRDFVVDKTKSNINHESTGQKAFIQQFVQDHVDGIRLKNEGIKKTCKACKMEF